MTDDNSTDNNGYWDKTVALMRISLIIWFIFSFVIHLFVDSLNSITILSFPLGWYMGAQGSLIAFVILIFWFSSKQNQLDIECNVAEDEETQAE